MVKGASALTRQTKGDRMFDWLNYTVLAVILLIIIYPLLFVISASVSDPQLVNSGKMWLWPKGITFLGYEKVFQNKEILSGYLNTILYTVLGTSINLFMTILAAFPLSRKDLAGRNIVMALFVFTMFFSGGLIPSYLLVKKLGMLNTMWALIIPNAVSIWNIIIVRTFFQHSIPNEIQEAAAIDGISDFQMLWRIILPLSMPILAVMTLFYSVAHWNSYFNALIYLTDQKLFPLQLVLREILIQNQMDQMAGSSEAMTQQILYAQTIKYAVVIVANLPVLMLYPFLQKYFTKGVMIGAIKG
ncbi:carbohydrate ABC transporter permease [Paenibacillus aceris]|uniref:Aldouronate transport system permease protein n=1 Tax=Paenibacillus aceris TaxID=869555 RepID=A0ABS4I5K6_9BACL|nr:carbohydrate ABC transporter permease [Paenibacillus aceris]MBP1966190.1 putative aldouronate transport system permease protein [Paenibacillus aceris]NHW33345.1 carbohydrate ABC transporter permease [Paenibacillus aceris]